MKPFGYGLGPSRAGESARSSGRFVGRGTLRGHHINLRTSRVPDPPSRPQGDCQENFVVKVNYEPEQAATLDDLNLASAFHRNLIRDTKITELRAVQRFMLPYILNPTIKTDLLVVGPTSCGKTYGMLIGVLQHCIHLSVHNAKPSERRPKVIIIGASQEAVVHVYNLAVNWSDKVGIFVGSAIAGSSSGQESNRFMNYGADLVISTMGRLHDWVSDNTIDVSDVDFVVFDDASTLITCTEFERRWHFLIDRIPDKCRLFTLSSTWADETRYQAKPYIRAGCNEIRIQSTVNEVAPFSLNPAVEQHFIKVKLIDSILKAIEIIGDHTERPKTAGEKARPPKTVVFTTEPDHAAMVTDSMRMWDRFHSEKAHFRMNVACVHKGIKSNNRQSLLAAFQNEFEETAEGIDVLVATDHMATGIVAPVDLVINLDFPPDLASFIQRVGRAGRDRYRGKAFTMIDVWQFDTWSGDKKKALVDVINEVRRLPTSTMPDDFPAYADQFTKSQGYSYHFRRL
uniref:ATP-dependent RNA helicase n=1 Tax=Panagrellus redivivus TaxID=6233 RepID=A0A7E4ZQC5_PANRE